MTRFRWGVASDVGQVRSVNQDNALATDGFFAVADGMGGHRGGEVASAITVEVLAAALPMVSTDELLDAVDAANAAVLARAADDPSLRGMGTTLCALALVADDLEDEPLLTLANVGDSRIYQFAGGVLEQMTDDHSVVGELVRQGRLTDVDAETHPQRNILTRALGIDAGLQIDAWQVRPIAGDRWLLCSDGLFNEVTAATIAEVLRATPDPAMAADTLVRLANEHGGRDNITVVVVDVVSDDAHAAATPAGAQTVAGELALARRRVVSDDPTLDGARAPTSAPGIDAGAPTRSGDEARSSALARAGRRAPTVERATLADRMSAGWRVMAFVLALAVLAGIAVVAWVAYGRDPAGGPAPTIPTTVAPSTTASSGASSSAPTTTLAVTATSAALAPTSTVG